MNNPPPPLPASHRIDIPRRNQKYFADQFIGIVLTDSVAVV